MSTLAVEQHPLAQTISFTEDSLVAELIDDRTISVPLNWFPSLSKATPAELNIGNYLAMEKEYIGRC